MGATLKGGSHSIVASIVLFDDLDDPAGVRFDQNRVAVHNRVTIFPGAVFRRHIVIGDAFLWQNRAEPHVLAILIGRMTPFDDISVKAGTLIDAENPGYSTDHASNDTADDGTDGASGPFAVSCAALDATRDPLGVRHDRQCRCRDKGSNSDKAADHDISNDVG
jgi:hypothetical protein